MDIAKKIKKMREQAGISATQLAARSGLSLAYISKLEGGEYKSLSLTSSKSLAEGLGLALRDFLETIGFLDNKSDSPSYQLLTHALRKSGYSTDQTATILKYAEFIKSQSVEKPK
jgi:transcriptional regulator with XRE-family HTH domain